MLLRQVQAHSLQGHHLRQVRRRGHPLEGPPRADGPHPARQPGQPHLVLQGHARRASGILLDISPRNLERILYFALYIVTGVDEDVRERFAAEHRGRGRRPRRQGRGAARRARGRASGRHRPQQATSSTAQLTATKAELESQRANRTEEIAAAAQGVEARLAELKAGAAEETIVFEPTGEVIVAAGEKGGKAATAAPPQVVSAETERVNEEIQSRERDEALAVDQKVADLRAAMDETLRAEKDQLKEQAQGLKDELRKLRDELESIKPMHDHRRDRAARRSTRSSTRRRRGRLFTSGMGAEAVRDIISRMDLEKLGATLHVEVRTSSGQRRKKAIKRLRLIEAFRRSGTRPEWMILSVLPVIPPDLRPMVQLDGGRFATSDLNDLYRRVINRNNRLKRRSRQRPWRRRRRAAGQADGRQGARRRRRRNHRRRRRGHPLRRGERRAGDQREVKGDDPDPRLNDAIAAAGAANALVVVAAGNDSRDIDSRPSYPAAIPAPNLIGVAATAPSDGRGLDTYSNYGRLTVGLAAPGGMILSTTNDGRYGEKSGTSMAAPMVSGVAALMVSLNPGISAIDLRALLLQHAGDRRSGRGGLCRRAQLRPRRDHDGRLRLDPTAARCRSCARRRSQAHAPAGRRGRLHAGDQALPRAPGQQERGRADRAQGDVHGVAPTARAGARRSTPSMPPAAARRREAHRSRLRAGKRLVNRGAGSGMIRAAFAARRARAGRGGPARAADTTITMSGSSVAQAVLADLAYFYGHVTPSPPRFSFVGGGTTIGITDAARGVVDAGMVSRDLGATDPPGLVLTPFALSGVCLVTNVANPVPGLTRAQVQDLVAGRVTSWTQVPGSSRANRSSRSRWRRPRSAGRVRGGLRRRRDRDHVRPADVRRRGAGARLRREHARGVGLRRSRAGLAALNVLHLRGRAVLAGDDPHRNVPGAAPAGRGHARAPAGRSGAVPAVGGDEPQGAAGDRDPLHQRRVELSVGAEPGPEVTAGAGERALPDGPQLAAQLGVADGDGDEVPRCVSASITSRDSRAKPPVSSARLTLCVLALSSAGVSSTPAFRSAAAATARVPEPASRVK